MVSTDICSAAASRTWKESGPLLFLWDKVVTDWENVTTTKEAVIVELLSWSISVVTYKV